MYSKLQDGNFMIAGFVARDAEMKKSQNGKTYTKWSVKVGEKPSQTAGERGEAIWTNCIAWHDTARFASTIKKGDTVFCIGKLEVREHEGKTYKTLNCEYISIMGKSAGTPAPTVENAVAEYEEIIGDDEDGDLPF